MFAILGKREGDTLSSRSFIIRYNLRSCNTRLHKGLKIYFAKESSAVRNEETLQ